MKESYIKLPNITVSKLQDVADYLDENNIEYIEDYKEEVELNKYKEVLDKIKEKVNQYELIKGYYDYIEENGYVETTSHDTLKEDILKLLGEIK